jgi:mono/diheme cytochrome c family protein
MKQIFDCAPSSESDFEMKKPLVICLLFAGCETANYAPVVTPQTVAASHEKRAADVPTLEHGRKLFVHRCIECHTLTPIWKYSVEDWPQIVNNMSHRASLKPSERDAVVAYILAIRSQE